MLAVGCSKERKAEKTLRGTWNIKEYDVYIESSCNDTKENFWTWEGGEYGTATFDKKTFTLELDVDPEGTSASCYDYNYDLSGEWNIDEHIRELLVLHTYEGTFGSEKWDVEFESADNYVGAKADGQDIAWMTKTDLDGSVHQIVMVRIE